MLEEFTVGADRCNKALAWQAENEIEDWEKVAVWFLREYESHWKTWVTDDAHKKIKLPLARPSIMAGVNQTIMLALAMIASIVIVAIMIDRVRQSPRRVRGASRRLSK